MGICNVVHGEVIYDKRKIKKKILSHQVLRKIELFHILGRRSLSFFDHLGRTKARPRSS